MARHDEVVQGTFVLLVERLPMLRESPMQVIGLANIWPPVSALGRVGDYGEIPTGLALDIS